MGITQRLAFIFAAQTKHKGIRWCRNFVEQLIDALSAGHFGRKELDIVLVAVDPFFEQGKLRVSHAPEATLFDFFLRGSRTKNSPDLSLLSLLVWQAGLLQTMLYLCLRKFADKFVLPGDMCSTNAHFCAMQDGRPPLA